MSGFETWLREGIESGWCGPLVCATHDGIPTSLEEDEHFDDGDDVCVWIVRPYECSIEKTAVENNHPPSKWRK